MKTNVIYNEDCLEGMKRLSDNSIDLFLTDPPYGISFMGRLWDKAIPSIDIWKESLRVLKPGAFAFVMCIPRQDCLVRMIISLEDAGFNVSFSSIYWAYASGFPKSQNIGKAVDKRRGCDVSKYIIASSKSDSEIANYCKVSPALVRFWRKNERQIMYREWCKLKKLLRIENEKFDKNLQEVEREVVGRGNNYGHQKNQTGYGFNDGFDKTLPATSQAQTLDGSYGGFQPKPAVEVVIVAMKPLSEKTYVDQALKNGKGVTWLEDCKIPYITQEDIEETSNKNRHADFGSGSRINKIYGEDKRSRAGQGNYDTSKGRFPANLLCSDDVLNDGKNRKGTIDRNLFFGETNNAFGLKEHRRISRGDSGSFSRYFSLDSWWEKRLAELPESVRRTFPFLIVPKASKAEKEKGLEKLSQKRNISENYGINKEEGIKKRGRNPEKQNYLVKNTNPCVKPIKLMSYLITLGSRPGDLILDPFLGSGTTAIAAKMLNRRYIGYEINREYFEIAKARLKAVTTQLSLFT